MNFIATSDWHVRLDKPICRIDNFQEAQTKKIRFILSLGREHKAKILIGGDLGNKPQWGDKLLNYFINILNEFQDVEIITTCGQHDLLNHRLNQWKESGLGVLHKKGCIRVLTDRYKNIQPFSYSEEIKDTGAEINLIHTMVIKDPENKLWKTQVTDSAKRIMRKLPRSKIIITGDNHQSFVVKNENKTLINCGSIMRTRTTQIDFKPRVFLINMDENKVEPVYLPIEENVIDDSHLTETKERDGRIESFVNRLNSDYEIGFDFPHNMKKFLNRNRQRNRVVQKLWEAIDE